MPAAQELEDSPPDRHVGLVLLGASAFPHYPASRGLDHASFGRSATAFRAALETPGATLAGKVEVLDLFDSADPPTVLVSAIQRFLTDQPGLTDLIIYYCGHGWFLRDSQRSYALLLRATDPNLESFTSLPIQMTRESLDAFLVNRRLILVLDCCFAGHAVAAFQSGTVGDVVEAQVFRAFPPSGTTMLLASSKDQPGIAPGGEEHTMFTGALVHVLQHGLKGAGPTLSLDEVMAGATDQIQVRWRGEAVLPEIHSPRKARGDIARKPFFANPAFRPAPSRQPTRAERELLHDLFSGLRSSLPRLRRGSIESMGEVAASTMSPSLRRRLLAIVANLAEHDDSKSVRDGAASVLALLGSPAPASVAVEAPVEDVSVSPLGDPPASPDDPAVSAYARDALKAFDNVDRSQPPKRVGLDLDWLGVLVGPAISIAFFALIAVAMWQVASPFVMQFWPVQLVGTLGSEGRSSMSTQSTDLLFPATGSLQWSGSTTDGSQVMTANGVLGAVSFEVRLRVYGEKKQYEVELELTGTSRGSAIQSGQFRLVRLLAYPPEGGQPVAISIRPSDALARLTGFLSGSYSPDASEIALLRGSGDLGLVLDVIEGGSVTISLSRGPEPTAAFARAF